MSKLKQTLKLLGFTATAIVALSVMIGFMAVPFMNPDMTQTRLLLTFWPQYLVGMVVFLVCIMVADWLK